MKDIECRLKAEEASRKRKTAFRDQLPALPAKLKPFNLDLKRGTDWREQSRDKQSPSYKRRQISVRRISL